MKLRGVCIYGSIFLVIILLIIGVLIGIWLASGVVPIVLLLLTTFDLLNARIEDDPGTIIAE